jgi:fermentation-respiration switch protein FrsA (DUF1100 family)
MRRLAVLALLAALGGCTHVFFQPHKVVVTTPGQYGIDYQPVEMRAADGTTLFAWFLPARGQARGTVLYLHGNAENISTHFSNVAWMPAAGFNVLAMDYRGYGGSEGRPSLSGVQLDIDAGMRTLLERQDVDPRRIILFGQSLGGALAIYYAAHGQHRGHLSAVIADSAFSDYREVAREKLAGFFMTWPFQWLPDLTIDNRYSPQDAIAAVSPVPLLLVHGEADGIVPAHHSQRLLEQAAEPKQLWLVPQAGHIQGLRSKEMRQRLAEFMRQHSGEQLAATAR